MFIVKNIKKAPKTKGMGAVSALSKLVNHPTLPNHAVSIAHDGFIRLWDLLSLKEVCQRQFKTPYLTSLTAFREGFLLGIGNGLLMHLNQKFETIGQYLIHSDCLTDIVEHQNYIITVSFDGKVVFLNKNNLNQKIREVDVQSPINQVVFHQGCLYLTGKPTYCLNLGSFEIKQLSNYLNLVVFENQIFGSSDQYGLIRLSTQEHTPEPCSFVFSLEKCILMISGGTMGFMHLDEDKDQMVWNIQKLNSKKCIKVFDQSCSILTCIQNKNNQVFFGGQDGRLYKVQLELSESWAVQTIQQGIAEVQCKKLDRKKTAEGSAQIDLLLSA